MVEFQVALRDFCSALYFRCTHSATMLIITIVAIRQFIKVKKLSSIGLKKIFH